MIDKFLGRETAQPHNGESADWEAASIAAHFTYDRRNAEFTAFAGWLETAVSRKDFLDRANELMEIEEQLKDESVGGKRSELVRRSSRIKHGLTDSSSGGA